MSLPALCGSSPSVRRSTTPERAEQFPRIRCPLHPRPPRPTVPRRRSPARRLILLPCESLRRTVSVAAALHAAAAHEATPPSLSARSSPCATHSSAPSSAAGAPLLSSSLVPPSTPAERKAVPLAHHLPPTRCGLPPPTEARTPSRLPPATRRRLRRETPRPAGSEIAAPPRIVGLGAFQLVLAVKDRCNGIREVRVRKMGVRI
ncbi:hypothetical protein PVAP13_3KG378500 [Panicum virgatum]|uniref:Uncharacterized protein n=1 Tax=Panicum virgatum TaxID=38727 RepID=A0A8T0V1H1_PANVG|nr:hypothetical protein PVAP13_3KG378500 [Panicum virgatum]